MNDWITIVVKIKATSMTGNNSDGKKKEAELKGMAIDRLRETAAKYKVSACGDKASIIKNIMGKMKGEAKTETYCILEEAIMSWTAREQKEYLKKRNLIVYGTKPVLTARIMGSMPIEDACRVTREWTTKMNAGKMSVKEKEVMEVEQVEGGNSMTEEVPITDTEMVNMETALKRKRAGQEEETTRSDEEASPLAPPKDVEGKTSDKDTSIAASARGGNDIINVEDEGEEGWKVVGDDESQQTRQADNRKRTRIGIMVTVPPASEPDKKLCLQLQKWFKKMKEIDGRLSVISWKASDGPKSPITQVKDIPNTMSKIRTYFSRAQVRSEGGKTYADVYIQHNVPMDDIKGDAEWFLKENEMGMYNKQLQVEATEQKGWLLYSTQNLDKETLEAAIEAEIGVKVAMRWKYINTDKYEDDASERKKWMAMHLEVDEKEGKKASRGLAKLYGSSSNDFPLGIRMRLVSEFREVKGNVQVMGKHTRLRVRQARFNAMIEGYPSDDIQMMDYEDGGITLRGLIMSIHSRNPDTPGNLFHAVGKNWKGRIVFSYLKNKTDEAIMIIDGLLPYLQFHHGERVNQFFDPEVVVEKEEWRWDDEKNTIINPLSKELDGLDKMDNDYDFSVINDSIQPASQATKPNEKEGGANSTPSNGVQVPLTAEQLALQRMNMVVTGGDTDSVSTMGNPLSPANIRAARATMMIPAREILTGGSSVTDLTIDSRVSALESHISAMEENITKRMENTLEKFFTRMNSQQSSLTASQLPGGELAGENNE